MNLGHLDIRIVLAGLAIAVCAASAAQPQSASSSSTPVKGTGNSAPPHSVPAHAPKPNAAERDCKAVPQDGKPPLKVCGGR